MTWDPHQDYDTLAATFRWQIPEFYNIAADICRWADGSGREALVFATDGGPTQRLSFDDLDTLSSRFANVLTADGFTRGDRLAVLLSQSPEIAISHLAGFKSALITVPLFVLFGEEALVFRLANSGAKGVVTDLAGAAKLLPLRDRLPGLERIYVTAAAAAPTGCASFEALLAQASDSFPTAQTRADDPAVIIYTSGTTGDPKGALHAHRVLLGHLPGVELPHDFFPQQGDRIWTPADWAWIGGLFDVLLPALRHGIPVLANRMAKFDPGRRLRLHGCPGRAQHLPAPHRPETPPPSPSAATGRQPPHHRQRRRKPRRRPAGLGQSHFRPGPERVLRPDRMQPGGRQLQPPLPHPPGLPRPPLSRPHGPHRRRSRHRTPRGETGHIGIASPDPVMFLGYWQNPAATAAKFAGDYLLTGDMARQDEDGYLWFLGRSDDVITSAGYRIGPGEIEDCLLRHPAVAMAGVAGIPDPIRTEIVKAWVVLRPGHEPSDA